MVPIIDTLRPTANFEIALNLLGTKNGKYYVQYKLLGYLAMYFYMQLF